MNPKQPKDIWHFSGDEETYTTINNAVAVDAGWAGMDQLTTIPITGHGFKASSGKLQSLVYIQGSTNYDGLRKIHAVATNTITIVAKYVAETFAGTETVKTMYSDDHPFEFLGFKVTLNAASATSENLTITIDSKVGSAFDNLIYSRDMDTIADINNMFDVPRKCFPGDKIDVAWDNTDDRTWAIELITRRLA